MGSQQTGEGGDDRLARAVELGTNVVAPIALFSALAIYFGSIRTGALYGYFGVDTAVLAFSIQDFAIRSIGFAFRPIVILIVAFAIILAAGRLSVALDARLSVRNRRLHLYWLDISYVGLIEAAVAALILIAPFSAVLGNADPTGVFELLSFDAPLASAVSLSVGSLIVMHAAPLLAQRSGVFFYRRPNRTIPVLVLGCIAFVLGLFWAASILAQRSGQEVAEFINSRPDAQAYVTIHSSVPIDSLEDGSRLGLPANGVYKYAELRLLSYTNSRWLLFTGQRSPNGRLEVAIVLDVETLNVVVGRS